jgi:protein FAM50
MFKKKRKTAGKGKLSFGVDDEEETESATSKASTPRESTPANIRATSSEIESNLVKKKKLGANTSIGLKPRIMTKSALQREAQQADIARQDFLRMREGVKATEVAIPFVFYDGTNVPGGLCRVKKGDHIWLFLDKARKVGAELGVGGDNSRRNWARVSVDDLMLVRGEVILPHVSCIRNNSTNTLTDVVCSTMSSITSCSTMLQGSMAPSSIGLHNLRKPHPFPMLPRKKPMLQNTTR